MNQMEVELKIPEIGESITVVTIGKIFKKNGDIVTVDEELLELETDKLNQVLYAPIEGRVIFRVKEGDIAKIGDVVATFEAIPAAVVKSEPEPKK